MRIRGIQMIKHTFRAVWPMPAAPRSDDALTKSLDRLDQVLDQREQRSVDPVASMIDGMFDR